MIAVIQAGGKGTRLFSITKNEIPKPMVQVAGKPILEWQIESLKQNGIEEFILIIGHLRDRIVEYFGDGSRWGIRISYIEEDQPLGTGGALFFLRERVSTDDFIFVYGDVLFSIDVQRMVDFHRETGAIATLFVHPNAHPFDSDLVVLDNKDKVLDFDAKTNHRDYWYDNCVNAGFFIFNRKIFKYVPSPQKLALEKDVLQAALLKGESLYGYRSPEYIKDVGTVERLAKATQELQSGFIERRNLKHPQKCIFVDRDGTLNEYRGLVYKDTEFELLPHVVEAIQNINASGYLVIMVTNQPVVARGLCSLDDVQHLHKKLSTLLGRNGAFLDGMIFCPHHPDRGYAGENPVYKVKCHCRKPDTGMVEYFRERYHIDLAQSWMVGDTTVDIQTGRNGGMRTVLVHTGEGGKDGKYDAQPDIDAQDLLDAVKKVLEGDRIES